LPNEPKVVQCLPGKLKKPVLANRIKIDQNRIKTPLKQHQTGTNEARIISISPVLRVAAAEEEPQHHLSQPPQSVRLSRQKKYFFEERSQTLPAIIDDRKKTNSKRTQIKPNRTQKSCFLTL
jgi:hypothetical protein